MIVNNFIQNVYPNLNGFKFLISYKAIELILLLNFFKCVILFSEHIKRFLNSYRNKDKSIWYLKIILEDIKKL
jgi:hypothetical protein